MGPGANSGIMYHVTDEGGAAWATGPEVQLEDNKAAQDPQRCGWLYALYQPGTIRRPARRSMRPNPPANGTRSALSSLREMRALRE